MMALAGTAQATTIVNFGTMTTSANGATLSFLDVATPTGIIGDATISLTVSGDFNDVDENIAVSLDGFSLGRVLNANASDDVFNFEDDTALFATSTTATATIANADFANLIADGLLSLVLELSTDVNFGTQTVSSFISFEAAPDPSTGPNTGVGDTPAVPLPASALLLMGGLAGLGAVGRRASRKST